MSKHNPMQSCKDFLAKPSWKLEGVLAQCIVCNNKFIGKVAFHGSAFWQLIEEE